MGYRLVTFAPGHIYHICHRGVAQKNIFTSDKENYRFLEILRYYLPRENPPSFSSAKALRDKGTKPKHVPAGKGLVDLLGFCLMDNHVHLLLKENVEGGISKYTQRVFNSYARYFNTKHERSGALFAGRFHAVLIDGDEQFLHVMRYIHLNPFSAGMLENPFAYKWSSVSECVDPDHIPRICHLDLLLGIMSLKEYKKFVIDYADYARELEQIKHLTLD